LHSHHDIDLAVLSAPALAGAALVTQVGFAHLDSAGWRSNPRTRTSTVLAAPAHGSSAWRVSSSDAAAFVS
jgi:hypothetical protein